MSAASEMAGSLGRADGSAIPRDLEQPLDATLIEDDGHGESFMGNESPAGDFSTSHVSEGIADEPVHGWVRLGDDDISAYEDRTAGLFRMTQLCEMQWGQGGMRGPGELS